VWAHRCCSFDRAYAALISLRTSRIRLFVSLALARVCSAAAPSLLTHPLFGNGLHLHRLHP
jgi:hypothetical protein